MERPVAVEVPGVRRRAPVRIGPSGADGDRRTLDAGVRATGVDRRRRIELDADDLRVVIAGLIGELGVDVHAVVHERPARQRRARLDVIERLRVALEDVRVPLVRGQRFDERRETRVLEDRHRFRRTRSR